MKVITELTSSARSCARNIKKLKKKFAKQARREDNSQYLITYFVYFETLDNILGNRPVTQPKIIIDSLGHKSDREGESTVSDSDKKVELDDSDYMDNSKMTLFGYCIKFIHIIKGVDESILTRL